MPYTSIRQWPKRFIPALITPAEMVFESLERIDEMDGEIQAFVTVMRR